jgi:hypothetical protein
LAAPPFPDPGRPAAAPPFIGPVPPRFIGPVVPRHPKHPATAISHLGPAKPAALGSPRPVAQAPRQIGLVPDADVLPAVKNIVTHSVQHPETPIALGLILVLFLLVQHRFDRRDPKLRVAPRGETDELRFGSAVRPA